MVKQKVFEWEHVTIVRKLDKVMHVIQCKHCHHVFVGGPLRNRAHLSGLKGSCVEKYRRIDVVIRAKEQKMVFDISCANVDVNVKSTSINEMPS